MAEGLVVPCQATRRPHTRTCSARVSGLNAVADQAGLFRALVEHSPDVMVRYDLAGRRQYANPAWSRLSGRRLEEVLGKTVLEAPTIPDPRRYHEALMSAARGMAEEIEIEFENSALGRRHIHVRFTPELDAEGRPCGIFAHGRDITTRTLVEPHIRKRLNIERELSRLIEVTPGVLFTFLRAASGAVAMPFASGKLVDVLGYWSEDLAEDAAPLLSIMHPDDVGLFLRSADESAEAMTPWRVEFRAQHPVKGELWIEWLATPGRQEGGILWYGFMHDIGERKRREAELQQQASFQETLLKALCDVGLQQMVIENGRIVHVGNRALAHEFGFTDAAIDTCPPLASIIHPDDRERVLDYHRRRIAGETVAETYELSLTTLAGERREYETTVSVVPGSDPVRVISIGKDVTERKRMEAALARHEREFRSLAENLPDNIARWDVEGRYLYINPTHERTLGAKLEEVLGQPIPDSHEAVKAAIAQVVATSQAIRSVRQPALVDGLMELHDVSLVPEFDEAGRVVGVLGLGRDMTGFYRMQDTIAAREQAFRSLAESSPDFVFRYDRDGRIRYLNGGLIRFVGLASAYEVIGRTPGEAWPDGRFAEIEQAAARCVARGETASIELATPKPDGELSFHQISIVPERDTFGEIIGTLGFGRDITARKEMESALKKREWMLQEAQRIAHVGSWDVDIVNDVLHWSDEIFRIWEIDKAQFKADFAAFLETVHPDDRERVTQAYNEALANHTLYEVEHRLLFADGRVKYILERGEPQYDAQGRPVRFIGTSLDITERKNMEDAMRRSQEMLADAQKMAQLGSWDWDVVRDCVEWSEMAYEIYTPDKRPAEPGFQDFMSSLHPDDRERVVAAVHAAFEQDTPFELDHRVVSIRKGVRTVHAQGRVFRDGDGRPLRMVGTVQDITERNAVEVARESALAEAVRLAKLRGTFVAQMSHELRTPLNGILGFVQLLQMDETLGAMQREWVDIIRTSGDHLLALINQVLDFAKIEADSLGLTPVDFDLGTMLGTVANIVRVRAEQKKLVFLYEVEAGLPGTIRGDELRLRQILLNLLGNAVKFTDRGEVSLKVSQPSPSRLRFEVRDSGVGIAESKLDAIFQPFEQAGDACRAAEGTGLGLAISRRLVRLMGGDIEVESRLGEGSMFAFELVVAAVGNETIAAETRGATRPTAAEPAPTVVPPEQELAILHELAQRGNLRHIARHATRLIEFDARYAPFAGRLTQMAKAYQSRPILEFLERCLAEARGHD
jgi:PAS domain S-box-containing protein